MAISANWTDFSRWDGQRLFAILTRHLPRWVTLLLVVALGWQAAKLVWLLVAGPQGVATIPAAVMTDPSSPTRPGTHGVDVTAIANAHLFGEVRVESAAEAPPANVENLEETRLNLTLKGTIAATDESGSIAIIADDRNNEKIYGLNDSIAQGTTLHAVYADRVVLNRSGSLEVLKLPREFPDGTARRRNAAALDRANAPQPDESQSIQAVVAQNVTKLADVIRPTPYFVGGEQQGYRVYPGRDRRQFAALGLRPGDLIKDIDGAALTDPQQAMEIFQSLGTAEQVSVTVERNGQPQVLVLNTNQLSLEDE
ncbi:MAG: type II secretion system protein GspC [Woeseia sp.]